MIVEMPKHADHAPDYLDETPPRKVYGNEKETWHGSNQHGGGDYNLKSIGHKEGQHPWEYRAVHDHSDEVHMITRGGTTRDKHFIANETRKHPDSEISAPDFYKSILKIGHHKGIESGNSQTDAGKHIWHRLAHDHPDVEVTHHELKPKPGGGGSTRTRIRLHKGDSWHKNFDDNKNTVFRMKLRNK